MAKLTHNKKRPQETPRQRRLLILRLKEANSKKPLNRTKNEAHFKAQNYLRALLEKVRPRAMKPQQEIGTGVDFVFAGKKIDFKFGFGQLGNDTISIRMKGNELLNKSDWTMVCNEKGEIIIFPTKKISDFVIKNTDLVKKNMTLNKGTYSLHKILLVELLGEIKYTGNIKSSKALLSALKKMNRLDNPNMPKKNLFAMVYPTLAQRKNIATTLARPTLQPRFDRRIGQQRNR